MTYSFRLEPPAGADPVLLDYATYKALFSAMGDARLSFLMPMTRHVGPHSRLHVAPESLEHVLEEIERIRKGASSEEAQRFLAELASLVKTGITRGEVLVGGPLKPGEQGT